MYNTANCYSSVDSNCTRGIHDDSKLSTEMAQELISANITTLEPIEAVESVEVNAKGRSHFDLGFSNSADTVDDLHTMSDSACNATDNKTTEVYGTHLSRRRNTTRNIRRKLARPKSTLRHINFLGTFLTPVAYYNDPSIQVLFMHDLTKTENSKLISLY